MGIWTGDNNNSNIVNCIFYLTKKIYLETGGGCL